MEKYVDTCKKSKRLSAKKDAKLLKIEENIVQNALGLLFEA